MRQGVFQLFGDGETGSYSLANAYVAIYQEACVVANSSV